MNWTPPILPQKTEPEDLIREIEDDPLTQFVWTRAPEMAQSIRQFSGKIRRWAAAPNHLFVRSSVECRESSKG